MKKLMVLFVMIMLAFSVSILVYAQNPEGAKPEETSIVQMKARVISVIDQRINLLQEGKSHEGS